METTVETTTEISLLDRIYRIEAELKELKRAARHELKARRRRRGSKKEGGKKEKGETPSQLKPWHDEVRRVWEELKATDAKTPYKRAVAEAHSRRGKPVAVVAAVAAPVAPVEAKKKATKKSSA
jgi:multidrug resistance efflux pump